MLNRSRPRTTRRRFPSGSCSSVLLRGAQSHAAEFPGPDTGSQYRSVIFYTSDEQKKIADAYIAQLDQAKIFKHKIVTEVTPFKAFYPAEKYHQNYATLHPDNPYIARFDAPKVEDLQKQFPQLYRPQIAESSAPATMASGK